MGLAPWSHFYPAVVLFYSGRIHTSEHPHECTPFRRSGCRSLLDALLARGLYAHRHDWGSPGAVFSLAQVACGRATCFYEAGPHPWDVCAAAAIIIEAGGVAMCGSLNNASCCCMCCAAVSSFGALALRGVCTAAAARVGGTSSTSLSLSLSRPWHAVLARRWQHQLQFSGGRCLALVCVDRQCFHVDSLARLLSRAFGWWLCVRLGVDVGPQGHDRWAARSVLPAVPPGQQPVHRLQGAGVYSYTDQKVTWGLSSGQRIPPS